MTDLGVERGGVGLGLRKCASIERSFPPEVFEPDDSGRLYARRAMRKSTMLPDGTGAILCLFHEPSEETVEDGCSWDISKRETLSATAPRGPGVGGKWEVVAGDDRFSRG